MFVNLRWARLWHNPQVHKIHTLYNPYIILSQSIVKFLIEFRKALVIECSLIMAFSHLFLTLLVVGSNQNHG